MGFFVFVSIINVYRYYSMKVVFTTDTTHNIEFVPRFYTSNTVVLTLRNEVDFDYIIVSNSFAEVDGIYTITFDYTFAENDRFEFTITDGSDIVYRGKLISTVQTPQQYKLTTDLYE